MPRAAKVVLDPAVPYIVGMHFRPPAKAVMAHLPAGASLLLVREPENPYDPNAIKVLVGTDAIPATQAESFAEACATMGREPEDFYDHDGPFHLGYIQAAHAKDVVPWEGDRPAHAKLAFDLDGLPFAKDWKWAEPETFA